MYSISRLISMFQICSLAHYICILMMMKSLFLKKIIAINIIVISNHKIASIPDTNTFKRLCGTTTFGR